MPVVVLRHEVYSFRRRAQGGQMAYVVTERCIRCRYMECVDACPVACFLAGGNMVVIAADECIDCGLCEPVCPTVAIVHDSDPRAEGWREIHRAYATQWSRVFRKGPPLADADLWKDASGKSAMLDPEPDRTCDTGRSAEPRTAKAPH